MIKGEFGRYEEYRDSGVEWLGDIPSSWKVKRLKDIGISIIGITYSPTDVLEDENAGVLVLRSSNIQKNKLCLLDTVYVGSKINRKQILRKGDILICSRNGSSSLIGKNICIDERTKGQTFGAFMTIYRTKYFRFIHNFFNSKLFESQSGLYMSSTVNQLTISTLNNFLITLPSIAEQKSIYNYLDTKIGQIDRKIDLLTQKVKKYNQLKQSLINETVTRGLDKTVVMKDSGIEWIGEVPENWLVKRLKEISEINKNTLSENTSKKYEFDYIDIGSVTYGTKGFSTERMTFDMAPSRAKRIVKKGDIIVSTVRTYLKAIAYIDGNCSELIVSTGFAVISPNKNLYNKFYSYLLTSDLIINEICALSKGVSYPAVNSSVIGDLFCIVPTDEEQQAIADYLDTKTTQIDLITQNINTQIIKLKELRKTLINDVVTGKIKVV